MDDEKENGACSSHSNDVQPEMSDQNLRDQDSLGTISLGSAKVKTQEQLASAFKQKRRKTAKSIRPRKGKTNPITSASLSIPENAARTSTTRRTGRVTKRRKGNRRPVQRRRPKRRPRVRFQSSDTMDSSTTRSDGTSYCEHCCCHSYRECKRVESSRALLASPLLIKSYAPVTARRSGQCEVSPEMIYAALRSLAMWRQGVSTDMILSYIMRNYPVCPDKAALRQDLEEKLRIASIAGMVCSSNNTWSLARALSRRLSTTHVTLFWEVYHGLDMAPVRRKVPNNPQKDKTQKAVKKR